MKEFEHKIATTLHTLHDHHAKKMSEWDGKLASVQMQVRQLEEHLWRT